MSDEDFTRFAVKEIVSMGLIDKPSDVIDSHVERVKKAYPAYFDTYKDIDRLTAYLKSIDNLYCVGRNGQHRYNNIDHSMMTSFETVKNILGGISSKDNIWNVNTEKTYHEEVKKAEPADQIEVDWSVSGDGSVSAVIRRLPESGSPYRQPFHISNECYE